MRKSNKTLGLKRPPSGFALFCSAMAQIGVVYPLARRLVKKTPSRSKARSFFSYDKNCVSVLPVAGQCVGQMAANPDNSFQLAQFHTNSRPVPVSTDFMTQFQSILILSPRRCHPEIRLKYNQKAKRLAEQNLLARRLGRAAPTCTPSTTPCRAEQKSTASVPAPGLKFPWLGGHLVCEAHLGAGAYGAVYRACIAGSGGGGVAALKLPGTRKDAVDACLQDEHDWLQKLRHPCILATYGFAACGSTVALVLELGKFSLSGLVAQLGQEDDAARWQLFRQICLGVGFCQSQSVLHGDLKPANIIVMRDKETVKLADFGMAQDLSMRPLLRGRCLYSPAYRPLEMLAAHEDKAVHKKQKQRFEIQERCIQ